MISVNRVLHKRQRKLIDVIDRHVMIYLTTYFRTTAVADLREVESQLRTCFKVETWLFLQSRV